MRLDFPRALRRLAPVAVLGLAACSRDALRKAFEPVAKLAGERTGQKVQWIRGGADDEAAQAAVNALLAQDLTADSAVQIALLNNRQLQATFEEVGLAQADLVQAGLLKNPVFAAALRVQQVPENVSHLHLDYSLAEDFIDILMQPLRKKTAKAELEKTQVRVADAILTLAHEVRSAFYALQGLLQEEDVHEMAVKADEAMAELAQRQHDAGNISDLDFSQHFAVYLQGKLELAREDLEIRTDREQINRLLGLWGMQTQWKLGKNLPELPAEDPPLENVEALAIDRRLDLEAARLEFTHRDRALALAKWGRIPAISLGLSVETENTHYPKPKVPKVYDPSITHEIHHFGHYHIDPVPVHTAHGAQASPKHIIPGGDGGGGTGGTTGSTSSKRLFGTTSTELGPTLEVEVPLFDQGQGRVARAESESRQAEDLLDALATDIRSQAREARERVVAARQVAEFYRDVLLPERQKIVVLSQSSFNRMHLGNYELLEAKREEGHIHRDYIASLRDYWIARADLERALGGSTRPAFDSPADASAKPDAAPAAESKNPAPGGVQP